MPIINGQNADANDFINAITTAVATQGVVVSIANTSQRATIIAKGTVSIPAGNPGSITINMKINGVVVDTMTLDVDNAAATSMHNAVMLMYSTQPAVVSTKNVSVDQTLINPVWLVIKI